jgi:hypothetical protein
MPLSLQEQGFKGTKKELKGLDRKRHERKFLLHHQLHLCAFFACYACMYYWETQALGTFLTFPQKIGGAFGKLNYFEQKPSSKERQWNLCKLKSFFIKVL